MDKELCNCWLSCCEKFLTGKTNFSEWFFRDILSDMRKLSVVREGCFFVMSYPGGFDHCWFQKCSRTSWWFSHITPCVLVWLTMPEVIRVIYLFPAGSRVHLQNLTVYQLIKIPPTLWNPKFRHHIHNFPPPVPLLIHRNPFPVPHFATWRSSSIPFSHLHSSLRMVISFMFPHQ